MILSPGSRLGPYEIVALQGIGDPILTLVCRARDTRQGRDVAIKVLPPGPAALPEARARFEREARVTLHLKHPNVLEVYDVAREGESDYVAMELVAGGSLRERLARGPLPLDQALSLGIEIADALDAAHSRGIVHGGLGPGCMLLTERGQAKVTDFGLGGFGIAGADDWAGHCSSPEQTRGDEVDRRTDLFSLGAILYEMVSGRRAFEGRSSAAIVEAIFNRNPAPVSSLKPGTPPELDRIIAKALEKDRELRYQTAADVRSDLVRLQRNLASLRAAEAGEIRSDLRRLKRDLHPSQPGASADSGSGARSSTGAHLPAPGTRGRRLRSIAGIFAALSVLAVGVFLVIRFVLRPPPPAPARLSLDLPAGVVEVWGLALSPNGRYLAFNARSSGSNLDQIWIQPMDGTPARPLARMEGSGDPFWSPDSRCIAYTPGDRVRTMELAGGEPVTICAGVSAVGGSWGSSGTMLLDTDETGIAAVSASGGQRSQAVWPDTSRGETLCRWPRFLPDGRHFLYLAFSEDRLDSMALRVGCLGTKETKCIATGEFSQVEYVPPGFIAFQRGRTLYAQPFDARRLRLAGDAVPVLEDVLRYRSTALESYLAAFSVSATGALVYRDELAVPRTQMAWLDRAGRKLGTLGPAGKYQFGILLSPDGTRVAVSFVSPGEVTPDIWIVDIARDVATRLTSDPEWEIWPIWSPDGTAIYYGGPGKRIWRKPASGIGEAQELPLPPGEGYPQAVTPDGRYLLAIFTPPAGKTELVRVSLDAKPRTTSLGFMGTDLSLSPDGRWLAYAWGESGRYEVYVVDFPGLTSRWRVSTDGGFTPHWSPDGKELFFNAPGAGVMSVPASTSPTLRLGMPVRLGIPGGRFAPASDGKRFLMVMPAAGKSLPPTKVVVNWQALLRR